MNSLFKKKNQRYWRKKGKPLCHFHFVSGSNKDFKGLDLIDRVPEELWMELCNIVQEAAIKTVPKKKKCKKEKWLSEEALNSWKRRN